jgi:hypothetical protein
MEMASSKGKAQTTDKAVLRIRIRIRIHMFLGPPDPDPSIIVQNSKKTLDSHYFVTIFDFYL